MPCPPCAHHGSDRVRSPGVNPDAAAPVQRDASVSVQKKVLKAAAAHIVAHGGTVGPVHEITQARVPVVKFTEAASAVNCDLTVCNDLSVVKSDFIVRLATLDDRFAPVVRLVRPPPSMTSSPLHTALLRR